MPTLEIAPSVRTPFPPGPSALSDDDHDLFVKSRDVRDCAVTDSGIAAVPRLMVRSFGMTDPGTVRRRNEDQFLIAELSTLLRVQQSSVIPAGSRSGDVNARLFLVADGIGGSNAGDVASAMLVRGIESFVLNSLTSLLNSQHVAQEAVAAGFQKALRRIEQHFFADANRHAERRGMGTTVTLALNLNSHLAVTHVGDGRCYVLRDEKLLRLTRDHTLVQSMLDQGLIAHDQAVQHRLQHVITNSVGGTTPGVVADSGRFRLEPGDSLLLCTDGLSRMVSDDQIVKTLVAQPDPQIACQRLVDLANAAGGRDNVTVIVARFDVGTELA